MTSSRGTALPVGKYILSLSTLYEIRMDEVSSSYLLYSGNGCSVNSTFLTNARVYSGSATALRSLVSRPYSIKISISKFQVTGYPCARPKKYEH